MIPGLLLAGSRVLSFSRALSVRAFAGRGALFQDLISAIDYFTLALQLADDQTGAMRAEAAKAAQAVSKIRIKTNLYDTRRWVGDVQKQVAYATVVALTRTTKRLVPIMEDAVRKSFDKPTAFSVRAFGTVPATKQSLESKLFIKDRQAEYLSPNIVGGRRGQKRFEKRLGYDAKTHGYWVPGKGSTLNAAGNLGVKQIALIAQKLRASGRYGEVFVGMPKNNPALPFGIWARVKQGRGSRVSSLKPLLIRVNQPAYRKRFDFFGIAERHAQRIFDQEFERAFSAALRSVRPVSSVLKQL